MKLSWFIKIYNYHFYVQELSKTTKTPNPNQESNLVLPKSKSGVILLIITYLLVPNVHVSSVSSEMRIKKEARTLSQTPLL
jgi:hypothetical protein